MRIRTIKPGFWTSLAITCHHPMTRLHFIGLWNYADDEGRGIDDPRLIKSALWPMDDKVTASKVERMQEELAQAGRILRYTDGERPYFVIVHWSEHQRVEKPQLSTIPPPDAPECSVITPGIVQDASRLEGKGSGREVEGKGKEQDALRAVVVSSAFDEFYDNAYPRKVGRRKARDAFFAAANRADPEAIIEGARRLAEDPNLPEPQYVPHPTTWLNRDGWDDDPLPLRNGKVDKAQLILRRAEEVERGRRDGGTPGSDAPSSLPAG